MALCDVWMEGMTSEIVERAESELGETATVKKAALQEFRRLIREEDGLHPLMDDSFLLRFLRVKKFDTKQALKTLKNYYAYKAKYSGIVTDISPKDAKTILDSNVLFLSPKRDPNGGAVIVMSVGSLDLEKGSAEQVTAATFLLEDLALYTDAMQVCGVSVVVDFAGMTMRQFAHFFRPSLIMKALGSIMDTWPLRVRGLHSVHEFAHVGFAYNTICKPFLSKKLRNRVFFHGENLQSLHDYFPAECLPEALGGVLGAEAYVDYRKEIYKKQALSERLNKYKYKGTLYPSKLDSSWTDREEPT